MGLTRREVLRASAGSAVVASIAGCDGLSTDPAEEGDAGRAADTSQQKEAPILADRVNSGDLPALEERLPASPLVVEPVERLGVYGGTWTTAMVGASDTAIMHRTIGYDQLVHFTPDWTEVVANVAESFEVGGDGREYTFVQREGMKWSDGEPFTADDIVFAYDDVWLNEDLYPAVPSWLLAGGEPPTLEKVDDYTVRFTFVEPHGLFLERLATPSGTDLTARPRHFLEHFHLAYNPDVEALAEEEGYAVGT